MYSTQEQNLISLQASAAVSAKRIVNESGAYAANRAIGVASYDAALGEELSVITSGVTVVTAGAALVQGAWVTADAAGKAVSVTPTNIAKTGYVEVLGKALEAASAADEEIPVLVMPQLIPGTV